MKPTKTLWKKEASSRIWMLSFLLGCSLISFGQKEITAGIRLQKTVSLYLENGIYLGYQPEAFLSGRTVFGLKYVSSRLGTAMGTNAIKQDNLMVFAEYRFRSEKRLNPFIDVNMGWFHADYGSEIFDELPNSSFLFSIEPGVSYMFADQVSGTLGFGYNLITGDGIQGPGTLYPLFYQLSVHYKLPVK